MTIELTSGQREARGQFRGFVEAEVVPVADRYEREERVPAELVEKLAREGYLGAALPQEYGGLGMGMLECGLLNEEVGRGCSSLRSLLTVHGMVGLAVLRWGGSRLRERWLPRLAAGTKLAAFALTEPEAGSDAREIVADARPEGDCYVLNGHKKWITFGQIAGLFLVFAKCEGRPAAFLVERERAGLSVEPVFGMLGVRASMLAELRFEECRVPRENLVGREGFALSHVASTALDYGRYSVAWGCVGIAQACLEASLRYAEGRRQFGAALREHQLVQQMLTDMIANVRAARLLCQRAGQLKDANSPDAVMETFIAKYFASTAATKIASDAVQIHGANGCSGDYPVQRYLRDAKVMEIIEGSTQIQQITIARQGYQELGA